MAHWVKIKDFRIDLDSIFAYEAGFNSPYPWPYQIELFSKNIINYSSGNNSFRINWRENEKDKMVPKEFQDAVDMIDQYFKRELEIES